MTDPKRSQWWRWGAGAFLLLLTAPFPSYLARAVWEEGKILWRRMPIAARLADTLVPPNEKAKLELVLAARGFAERSLGLPAGKRFTQYSHVDRDTLVLVLSAARRDTLALKRWWFPVVGRLPYKGFFDFEAARRAARSLEGRGYDTDLRPAAAFSTLGWFDDPLLSTTLRQDSIALVNTVLHELTHNRVFIKGEVEFNESFASFVGARGTAAFFRARGDTAAARQADLRWDDERTRAAFVSRLLEALDSAFAEHPGDRGARLQARDIVYRQATDRLIDSLTSIRGDSAARRVQLRLRFNNATLLARRVYSRDLALFDAVQRALGGDVRATVERVVAAASGAGDPFAAVRNLARDSARTAGAGAR